MKKCAIGVDIGGTSIKVGIVDERGKIIHKQSYLTDKSAGAFAALKKLADEIANLCHRAQSMNYRVAGVGIGAPGPIDVERGLVYSLTNVPGWKNFYLKKNLSKIIKKPVFLDNDANAMALGECLFGAGKGTKNVIALTLGTGVGGGIVIDGKLFHGHSYSAAEIGHMIINEDGPRCGCGSNGCIETYVGNGHFCAQVESRLKKGEKSILNQWIYKDKKTLTPLLVAEAAKKGDKFAISAWNRVGEHLGNALTGLVNIFNPETVIIGGGIALNGKILFDPTIKTMKKKAFPIAARSVRVVPAKLGSDAGLIGAAALAL